MIAPLGLPVDPESEADVGRIVRLYDDGLQFYISSGNIWANLEDRQV